MGKGANRYSASIKRAQKKSPPVSTMAIVLAAGKGERMQSKLPKVLVPVCGRPMLQYVIDSLTAAEINRVVVVVGYGADLVRAELDLPGIEFVEQLDQRGTGHAVLMCRKQIEEHQGPVLVVTGDSPMLQASSVNKLLSLFQQQLPACILGTIEKEDPTGYGRIVRNKAGKFQAIIEEKDATDRQRAICEVNVSTYIFNPQDLLVTLNQLTDDNVQSEYYITDCPGLMLAAGKTVSAHAILQPCEALSINSMDDLKIVEAELQRNTVE